MSSIKLRHLFSYFKSKRKTEHDQQAIRKITAVETMIAQKYLAVDSGKYQVAMLDNLWSMYDANKQLNLCESLKFYCNIQNAYKGLEVNKKQNLLISLKNENNDVTPFAYFTGSEIVLYDNAKS